MLAHRKVAAFLRPWVALVPLGLLSLSVFALASSNDGGQDGGYFAPNSTGFRLQHGFETVLVQPFGYDGFRVRAWPFRPPSGHEVSFVYDPPLEGPEDGKARGMSFDTKVNGTQFVAIRNGNTVVRTIGQDGRNYNLAFYRIEQDGTETLLTNEYAPLKSLNPRYYEWPGNSPDFKATYSFTATPDEMILGTGTQEDHAINKKGQVIDLINFNTVIPTPVYMSSKGYGFIWNTASEGRMEFGSNRNRFVAESVSVVDYIVVSAPEGDYDALQKRLSALTGRAPTPPEFSLGYLHSKLRYENQSEVIQLAQNFKDRDIPVSMIVIDYLSWAQEGDWGLDKGLWPDVAYMAASVKNLTGAEMMASLWPSVEDDSVNYAEMQAEGFLSATKSGPGTTDSWNGSYIRNYDSTNPRAREFLWSTLKRNYYDKGIKNFWIDQADGGSLGEAYENNGQSTFIQSIPYARPETLYHAGTQASVGKLYPWAHQSAIEEGFRNATNTERGSACDHISLSRSGYIGSQRFCSMIWSGDTLAVWRTLAAQVASGLSAASTGWGWWTVDAGGFQGDPTVEWSNNIDRPEYRELYVRWLQWTTFLPFMRNHGSRACDTQSAYTCDNEPWTYGEANTPIITSYIRLRYRLKAYLVEVFRRFHETGAMIMRPLVVDFGSTDPQVRAYTAANHNYTTQQYMFGPRLLVTPVNTPGAKEWDVYLPKTADDEGARPWTYYWTQERYDGGQVVKVPAPLEHIPLFHLGSKDDLFAGRI